MFCQCFSLISICYCIKYFNIYVFVLLGTHIFVDKTLPELQQPIHSSRLTMNGLYLSSKGFKSIIVGLTMHGSL